MILNKAKWTVAILSATVRDCEGFWWNVNHLVSAPKKVWSSHQLQRIGALGDIKRTEGQRALSDCTQEQQKR